MNTPGNMPLNQAEKKMTPKEQGLVGGTTTKKTGARK